MCPCSRRLTTARHCENLILRFLEDDIGRSLAIHEMGRPARGLDLGQSLKMYPYRQACLSLLAL